LEADETPGFQMLGKERCGIDFRSGLNGCLQQPGPTQRCRKAPCRLVEARDLDAGVAALDKKPDRPGAEVDRRHRIVVLRQNRPPDRIDRIIRLDERDRGMRPQGDTAVPGSRVARTLRRRKDDNASSPRVAMRTWPARYAAVREIGAIDGTDPY